MKFPQSLIVSVTFLATLFSPAAFGCSKVIKKGMDFQTVFASRNAKYVIKEDINLGGKTIRIGEGCTLVFKGGSLANGTLVGNKTRVKADDYVIFKPGRRTFRGYTLNGGYKYATKTEDAIIIEGTWQNNKCGNRWTGLLSLDGNQCAGLSINNYIRLHKRGAEVVFPRSQNYYVYEQIICSGYSIDFNGSTINSIDFDKVENKTIALPNGAQARPLKSLYGLIDFNCDNSYLKNLTIDGHASQRIETPSLGTECLLSMASNKNCRLQNITIKDAVGCGICTYAISNCTFDNVTIDGCGEHGIYTHSHDGTLKFNGCCFINCGQAPTLYKQRGQSACVKFSGARDFGYAALKNLKAYFTDCSFESASKYQVATFYSDIPYAEFLRCRWTGSVNGYSIVSAQLAEQTGKLVELKFIECDNPCARIQSVNTIRRLIRCTNVSNPFADAVELTDCVINVGYADIENNYTVAYSNQYDTPVLCTRCKFIKGEDDIAIRNTITNPRPMEFKQCSWDFEPSPATKYKGSYYLVFTSKEGKGAASKSVSFKDCDINLDKYRMLYCSDTDVRFDKCDYKSSYDTLVDGKTELPNRVRVSNMTNLKKKEVARHSVLKNE